jgi:hypothetical protein
MTSQRFLDVFLSSETVELPIHDHPLASRAAIERIEWKMIRFGLHRFDIEWMLLRRHILSIETKRFVLMAEFTRDMR